MRLRVLLSTLLVVTIILFFGGAKSDVADQCKPEIVQLKISGTRIPGMPLTFEADSLNTCADPLYFRFYYRANYATPEYDTSPWVAMHEEDYLTDSEITYAFPDEGKYIVVVWAFTDPNNILPQATCGSYVEISRSCLLSIDSIDVTGLLNAGGSCKIKVNKSNYSCGYKTYYYKYYCRANYGTPEYNTSPWVLMHEDDYVDKNEIEYAFPEVSDYIVVVWLIEDPDNINPKSVPIIGQTVSIHDTFDINLVETRESMEAEFSMSTAQPDSGDVYLDVTLYPDYESLKLYGTETTEGPDTPITMLELDWEDEMIVNFDDQERPESVSIEDNTNNKSYLTDISYYPDGSYDLTTYVDGQEAYAANSDEIDYKIDNGIDVEDNPFLASGSQALAMESVSKRTAQMNQVRLAEETKALIIYLGKLVGSKMIPDQIKTSMLKEDAEKHPFIKKLLSDPDLVFQCRNISVLKILSNSFKSAEYTCREKSGSAKATCIERIKKADKLLNEYGLMHSRIAASILIDLSEEFFKLPVLFPATYKGPGLVRAFNCGDCGGTDMFTLKLYDDGKAEVIWNFNIVTSGSSCYVEYPGGRLKTGTHDKRGHFQIPEHNINGHYTEGMASGGGTRTGGVCGVTVQFQCERQ